MLEILLTSDDVARVTVMSTYGPLTELIFSLAVLTGKRGVRYGAWTQDLSPVARQAGFALSSLVASPVPLDLISLISPSASMEAGIEGILETSAAEMRAELDAAMPIVTTVPPSWITDLPARLSARRELGRNLAVYYDNALGPRWSRLRAHLDAQAAGYARTLARDGVHAFLQTLHPDMRWSPPALTVNRPGRANRLMAGGRGMVIVPTVFAQGVEVFTSVARPDEPIVVLVPALRSVEDARAIWSAGSLPPSRALAALLGETRAAALDVISEGCTTTELARRLGISPATASHHATVLRSAGLIKTERQGPAVLHTVTPLGTQLLEGR